MKYEITSEQIAELNAIIVEIPYKYIKPMENRIANLVNTIESQQIKETIPENGKEK